MKQILSIISVFILSCSPGKSSEFLTESAAITVHLDSIQYVALKIGNIRYIPLETTDECLLGNADKILIQNNRIYVADFNKAMSLFVFDMNGKYLFKINKRGQGPGEYTSFRDFDIHNNKELYMFDNFGQKLLIFDLEGKYLRDIKFEYFFMSFCLTEDKIYMSEIRGADRKKAAAFAVYDIKSGNTTFLMDDKKFLYTIPITNSSYKFYYSPNTIYHAPKLSETIYSVTNDSIFPAITVKGLPAIPKDLLEQWDAETDQNARSANFRNSNYFLENSYIYETDDYISLQYQLGANPHDLLYNKHTQQAYKLLFPYFEAIGHYCIRGSTGTEFFSVVSFDADNNYHKKILESREELKNWDEEDNP